MNNNTTRLAAAFIAAFSLALEANETLCRTPDAPNVTDHSSTQRGPVITPAIELAVANIHEHTLVVPNSIQTNDDIFFLFGALLRYGISALTLTGTVDGLSEGMRDMTSIFIHQMAAFHYPFRSLSFENVNIETIMGPISSFPFLTNISTRNCSLTDDAAQQLTAITLHHFASTHNAPHLHFSNERAITDASRFVIALQMREIGGTATFD